MWNFAKIRNKCTITNIISYVKGKSAFFLISENGLVHLSNRDCIDREKIINVIRNGTLFHDKPIEKVEEMPTRESEQITKLWLKNLPKAVEYFDWTTSEKKNTGNNVPVYSPHSVCSSD
ncbi:hypothetical protein NECAME_13614 [Necator americanus]|uniref:Uncharacterized protein n=1 Tax=Necator americanus TaxID=51031 RepID=W2SWE8_NECAM|nr:hypothetical protein NECAME_13614 [Necator americanus]ETN73156.1 hypothetical protein NECAME_13614 [Necator americanus]